MRNGSLFFVNEKLLPKTAQGGSRAKRKAFLQAISQFLADNYQWLIPLLGSIVIFLEIVEHIKPLTNTLAILIGEVILIILLLAATGFLTHMLLISLQERSQVINLLHMKHELGMRLSSGQDIGDVIRKLGHQLSYLLPAADIELYLFDKNKSWFVLASDLENRSDKKDYFALPTLNSYPCQNCLENTDPALHPFYSCRQEGCLLLNRKKQGYCLPLVQGSKPIGLLQVYVPVEKKLEPREVKILENLADEISGSLAMAVEKKDREDVILTQKIRTIQLDIARDLHDTVGQNISYLRMKLDQLSEKEGKGQPGLDNQITHMRDIANESYDLVRGTLSVLQSESSNDLLHLFSRYAEQVADRSTFQVDFATRGSPMPLTPNQMRQLFYIFREALSNIEKHAHANRVCVELNWQQEQLTLSISDDGDGFDMVQCNKKGHYGLKFMKERIENINGSLSINSAVNHGTTIIVQLPNQS